MKKWTTKDIPSLSGKTAVVTGGTSGIGYEDAVALARAGASVTITGRSQKTGDEAVAKITNQVPGAIISFEILDLADLASVKACAKRITSKLKSLNILINNAGVMTPPKRIVTKDGFELQFATNYLGHFAFTKHLLPLLKKGKGRVISLSSIAARGGTIIFDDLQAEQSYDAMKYYRQSKLACLMFALELQKRSDAAGWGITSVATHPGISRTNLLVDTGDQKTPIGRARKYAWFLFQPPALGALPTLFAATSPNAKADEYYGPNGFSELRGYPKAISIPKQALDQKVATRLWDTSEQLSGTIYPTT